MFLLLAVVSAIIISTTLSSGPSSSGNNNNNNNNKNDKNNNSYIKPSVCPAAKAFELICCRCHCCSRCSHSTGESLCLRLRLRLRRSPSFNSSHMLHLRTTTSTWTRASWQLQLLDMQKRSSIQSAACKQQHAPKFMRSPAAAAAAAAVACRLSCSSSQPVCLPACARVCVCVHARIRRAAEWISSSFAQFVKLRSLALPLSLSGCALPLLLRLLTAFLWPWLWLWLRLWILGHLAPALALSAALPPLWLVFCIFQMLRFWSVALSFERREQRQRRRCWR